MTAKYYYRDIIFRGVSIDTWETITGSLITHKTLCGTTYYIFYIPDEIKNPYMYMVEPDTIQQFTGFYDKYNDMIYEGDKISIKHRFKGEAYKLYYTVYFDVSFNVWMIQEQDKDKFHASELSQYSKSDITIISNG